MRYAILSDIHANLEALSVVLDHAARSQVERYLCLGDVVGYGADPSACLERLDAVQAVTVAGNHDWACIGKLDPRWFNDAARRAVLWTRDQLGFTELDALRRLPLTATDGPMTLVHGTLRHPERFEYMIDLAQAIESLRICDTPFCLVGHTHTPCVLEYDGSSDRITRSLFKPEELAHVPLPQGGAKRCVLNPGSVGQPRDGDPRAAYAILDTADHSFSIVRLPYDLAETQRKIRAAGLPGFLADRLAMGR